MDYFVSIVGLSCLMRNELKEADEADEMNEADDKNVVMNV